MNLRVPNSTFFHHTIATSQARTAEIAKLQVQLSSGLRLQKPSDSPADMRDVLLEKAREGRMESTLANINDARSRLNVSNTSLLDINDALVSARTLALQANQPLDDDSRETLAQQVDALLSRVFTLANSSDRGDYIFSGTQTKTKPFVLDGDLRDAKPGDIQYAGGSSRVQALISPDVTVDTFYSGAEVFLARDRGETTFFNGETGARPGAGVDSAAGMAELQVQIGSVTFSAGSGVATGVDIADSTIIGPLGAHQLQIQDTSGTGTAGTVSLNGGAAVAFTSADTNLEITGPAGERIFLDMSAITAGFNGNVDITADGTLSTDGGATTVAIDFSDNQQILDSTTGEVTYVDSTQIRSTGNEDIEYGGTASLFDTLIHLRDDLRNKRNLAPQELSDAFGRRLDDLDRVRNNIMRFVGDQSVALENLDALQVRTEDLQLDVRTVINDLESADISEVILRLQQQENLLQFTYATAASIIGNTNLLNFLR